MVSDHSPLEFRNELLRGLSAQDLALLTPHLQPAELKARDELERPNVVIKHILFPESAIASVTNIGVRKKQLEVGIIGREGMTGMTVVLGGDRTPHSTYIQVSGRGHRMTSGELRNAMDSSPTLRDVLLRYVQAFMTQTAYTAISNGTGKLEEKLARWLLMAHDRVDGDELRLIHEFLALMLGVRRPGVTVAIHILEERGVIAAKRSSIMVLNRRGLEKIANGLYGVPEAEYARLMARQS